MTLDPKNREGLPPTDAKFLANIEEHGWAIMKVAPRVGEQGDCFAYSTGLHFRFRQPEILIFGLSLETMHSIINIIGNQMKGGVIFVPNQGYPDILGEYSCHFKLVDRSQYKEHLGFSNWFYEGYGYPSLQCFWPDRNGCFPWQSECNPDVRKRQPFLFMPTPTQASQVQ